jgi:carbon-monoxide dehydrogenase iron sulfur subunit
MGLAKRKVAKRDASSKRPAAAKTKPPKRAVSGRKRAQRIPPVEAGKQAARRELLTGTVFPLTPALPAADAVSTIPLSARQEMVSEMTAEFRRDILVDAARCNGCLDCVEACKAEVAPQHKKWKTPVVPRIEIRLVDGVFVPLLCRNCEEAPCMVYCLTGCRARDTSGWVVTDYDRCVGCWMCVMSCPFGAIIPVYREKIARKCDGCTHRDVAPCVAACGTGALVQSGTETLSLRARRASADRIAWDKMGGPMAWPHVPANGRNGR